MSLIGLNVDTSFAFNQSACSSQGIKPQIHRKGTPQKHSPSSDLLKECYEIFDEARPLSRFFSPTHAVLFTEMHF